jgi:hypothetical protein
MLGSGESMRSGVSQGIQRPPMRVNLRGGTERAGRRRICGRDLPSYRTMFPLWDWLFCSLNLKRMGGRRSATGYRAEGALLPLNANRQKGVYALWIIEMGQHV